MVPAYGKYMYQINKVGARSYWRRPLLSSSQLLSIHPARRPSLSGPAYPAYQTQLIAAAAGLKWRALVIASGRDAYG